MTRQPNEEDSDDLWDPFADDPMLARVFAETHDQMNKPWFYMRVFIGIWLRRIRQWIGWE